jgi:predicted O-methyltransferase YrrM
MTDWKEECANYLYYILKMEHVRIPGWLTEEEGLLLFRLARGLSAGSIVVEVGSFMGKSSRWLAAGCMLSESHFYPCDLFNGILKGEETEDVFGWLLRGDTVSLFLSNMLSILGNKTKELCYLKGDNQKFAATWNRDKIDLLFIDGDHTQAWTDFQAWEDHLAPNAWVAFHDVTSKKTYGEKGPWLSVKRLMENGWRLVAQENLLVVLRKLTPAEDNPVDSGCSLKTDEAPAGND